MLIFSEAKTVYTSISNLSEFPLSHTFTNVWYCVTIIFILISWYKEIPYYFSLHLSND